MELPLFKMIGTAPVSSLLCCSFGRNQRSLKGGFSTSQMLPALGGMLQHPGSDRVAEESWPGAWHRQQCEKLLCSESCPDWGCSNRHKQSCWTPLMYLPCQCQGPWEGTTAMGSVDRSLLLSSPSNQACEMLHGEMWVQLCLCQLISNNTAG